MISFHFLEKRMKKMSIDDLLVDRDHCNYFELLKVDNNIGINFSFIIFFSFRISKSYFK